MKAYTDSKTLKDDVRAILLKRTDLPYNVCDEIFNALRRIYDDGSAIGHARVTVFGELKTTKHLGGIILPSYTEGDTAYTFQIIYPKKALAKFLTIRVGMESKVVSADFTKDSLSDDFNG